MFHKVEPRTFLLFGWFRRMETMRRKIRIVLNDHLLVTTLFFAQFKDSRMDQTAKASDRRVLL